MERQREIKGKISIERTLYIDSKGITSAQALANAVRDHWGIENRLHWVLNVTFREDECRVRVGHAQKLCKDLGEKNCEFTAEHIQQ